MLPHIHPAERVSADLRGLGLPEGALVMTHASLRAVGQVEGGADGLIDAIREVIGPRGTMLMVLGALDAHAWVNERPEPERAALLAEAEPFDAGATPAAPDVGVLAEVFRRRPETVVSDHPEGRLAAAGPLARELLDDPPWDDYFGPGSALERLVDAGGLILRLGADLDTVTALHYAEYLCSVDVKRRVRRHRLVSTPQGPAIRSVASLDDEHGIVDYPGRDYFEDLLLDYLARGRTRRGRVGEAVAELLDAADLVRYGVDWMDEHLGPRAWSVDRRLLMPRLDADLLAARKRRAGPEIDAIRSLKSALANAEAVPVEDGPYRVVEGSADVPRRVLTDADVDAVIAAEIDERWRAIDEYARRGQPTEALRLQLEALQRYQRRG